MRRALLALLVAAAPWAAGPAPEGGGLRHLVVLHTNDVHGQVLPRPATWLGDVDPLPDSGGLPRLAARLNELRGEIEAAGGEVLLVDGGDWFQGTPEGMVEDGRAFLRALAALGHDALCVGNHEFDHGVDVLVGHLGEVALPATLANVRDGEGAPLPGTRDVVRVERAGLDVAIVGLVTPRTPSITHVSTRELDFLDPVETLADVRARLGDDVDWILPVCHLGVEHERALARAHPWLDLVVGGHSHTFLRTGVREGDTLVVQAGAKASAIGRVDLWFDASDEVVRSEARLVELYEEPGAEHRNAAVDELCADLVERADERMHEVVGILGAALEQTRRPLVNSTSGNFITDVLRERTGADVAVHNRGGIRTSLPAGPVTRRDLFALLPFANHVETLTLDGAALTELFRRSIEEPGRSGLEFSGCVLEVRESGGDRELLAVLVDGRPVEPARAYRLTTNSYLAQGGDGWDLLEEASPREVDATLLRDALEDAFEGGPRTPSAESRYVVHRR